MHFAYKIKFIIAVNCFHDLLIRYLLHVQDKHLWMIYFLETFYWGFSEYFWPS